MGITTHVLDTARGQPASGIKHHLDSWDPETRQWQRVSDGVTDPDGRNKTLFPSSRKLETGARFRLTFETEAYLRSHGAAVAFFPEVQIQFVIEDAAVHYHVPLLLNPYGYSTYKGS
ncbi:MAG: hydroxyisourate hydrolase [Bdellovibrionota bacterium]